MERHAKKNTAKFAGKTEKRSKHAVPATSAGVSVVFRRGINGTDGILFDGKPQIAFVGRSNVGKSSAINAILGAQVARVSARPGKTQEINFFDIDARGYVVDLPGYGYAKMSPEAREKIRKHIVWYLTGGEAKPKLVVLIIDANVGFTPFDRELMGAVEKMAFPLVILANKIDKLSHSAQGVRMKEIVAQAGSHEVVSFSTTKKIGLTEVRAIVFGQLGIRRPSRK